MRSSERALTLRAIAGKHKRFQLSLANVTVMYQIQRLAVLKDSRDPSRVKKLMGASAARWQHIHSASGQGADGLHVGLLC